MHQTFLQINTDKIEIIIFGPTEERLKIAARLNYYFVTHCQHLKNIPRVKGFLSKRDTENLVHAYVFSRLDCCNGLFTGLSKKNQSVSYN